MTDIHEKFKDFCERHGGMLYIGDLNIRTKTIQRDPHPDGVYKGIGPVNNRFNLLLLLIQ